MGIAGPTGATGTTGAAGTVTIFGGTQGTNTINNDLHIAPFYHTTAGSEANTSAPMLAGNLTNFKVVVNGVPAATQAWSAEIEVNDVLVASCIISNPATPPHTLNSCTIAGPIPLADGDRLVLFMNRTSAAITATRVAWKADYTFAP